MSSPKYRADPKLVEQALEIPDVLATLFAVRDGDELTAASESAVTITKVADWDPEVVWPYLNVVIRGMKSPYDRVRRESIDTLMHLFWVDPSAISAHLPQLSYVIKHDPDLVVRNHAIDAVNTYGSLSFSTARRVLPILLRAAESRDGKHAARAMGGILENLPALRGDFPAINALARRYEHDRRSSVARMAGDLIEQMDEDRSTWEDDWLDGE